MTVKPEWLRVSYNPDAVREVADILEGNRVNTVCAAANCPNLGECFGSKTATFMIMGTECTRNCRFCNVVTARPPALDPEEPKNIAKAVEKLALRHAVITQVTRDDLEDGGAAHMAQTVTEIRKLCPDTTIEVLISDLKGDKEDLKTVLDSKPDVLNHNVEMIERLYKDVRPQAKYQRSLDVLVNSKEIAPDILTKTGFMVGLGETDEEVDKLLDDIIATDCDILTISQYLPPTRDHHTLDRYVEPEIFEKYKKDALEKGFGYVASSPLVRSSYRAAEAFDEAK